MVRTPKRKVRTFNKHTVTLEEETVERLDELADKMDLDRSEVIQAILEDSLLDEDYINELFSDEDEDEDKEE